MSNRDHSYYQKDQIDQHGKPGSTGGDDGSHAPTDNMLAVLLKVEGMQFVVLEFFSMRVFEGIADRRYN